MQVSSEGTVVSSFYEGERLLEVTLRIAEPCPDAVDDVASLTEP
jgi:hypothetical protein